MLARRGLVLGACLSIVLLSPAAAQTQAPAPTAVSGELFYTTYSPPAVKKVTFTYDSSGFRIGKRAWTAGLPGTLAEVPLEPFTNGTPRPITGDDLLVTSVGFALGKAFYTSSDANGGGNFGRIDLSTMRTQRLLSDLRGAHGI